MKAKFKNKSILITGGTGSFGKSFIKHLLKNKYPFKKIIIFSRDELKQHEMSQSLDFNDKKFGQLRYFIGDVRDKDRLNWATKEVNFIVHSAALKQVPTGEYNPFEVIKTNIVGSQNVVEAAIDNNVEKTISLSTDKAVSPVNLYGASKLCSDKLFISSNNIKGKKKISFSVVRYGNVMGSRGSVLPEFIKQSRKGYFKITNKQMTRFNILLPEAVEMVTWALDNTIGGEIIIPKIPSFKITDLAKSINSKLKFNLSGIRKGEKIHEDLISKADSLNTYDIKKYYLILNQEKTLINHYIKKFKAKLVKDGFYYSSDNNKDFLDQKKLKKLISNFKF